MNGITYSNYLDELIEYGCLSMKLNAEKHEWTDVPIEGTTQISARVYSPLVEQVRGVCGFLNVSQRAFVSAALDAAVKRALLRIEESGVIDPDDFALKGEKS